MWHYQAMEHSTSAAASSGKKRTWSRHRLRQPSVNSVLLQNIYALVLPTTNVMQWALPALKREKTGLCTRRGCLKSRIHALLLSSSYPAHLQYSAEMQTPPAECIFFTKPKHYVYPGRMVPSVQHCKPMLPDKASKPFFTIPYALPQLKHKEKQRNWWLCTQMKTINEFSGSTVLNVLVIVVQQKLTRDNHSSE